MEIADQIAPHWLTEATAIATTAGVDVDLYIAFISGVYRKLFLLPECTSYSVSRKFTRDNAILFHKNRDNAQRAQCAFILQSGVEGVNKFISTSDAAALTCMMMVNDKGLTGSADTPAGRKAGDVPPAYRGMMNTFLLRYIAEKADDCDAALAARLERPVFALLVMPRSKTRVAFDFVRSRGEGWPKGRRAAPEAFWGRRGVTCLGRIAGLNPWNSFHGLCRKLRPVRKKDASCRL